MIKITKNSEGSTLIELMCSVLVFAIGLMGILAVNTQSMSSAKRAEFAYTAYNLAKTHIETLRSMNFGDLAFTNETATVINANGVPDPEGQYIRSTDVHASYTSDSNLTLVTVSVNYLFQGIQSASPMKLSTVIFNG